MSHLRIARQWSREKFAILSLKPRSHLLAACDACEKFYKTTSSIIKASEGSNLFLKTALITMLVKKQLNSLYTHLQKGKELFC